MHPFQESLQTWFSRKVPDRAQNQCFDIPLVLSSDKGLVRKENQDRVAAIYTGKKSTNSLFAVAVVDGMGGMRDGGLCATLALSSFFYALVHYRNLSIHDRATEAIRHANEEVFKSYGGNGGSTLTAILIDASRKPLVVHLGDTRIYTFGSNGKVERHTIDDSLAEAVGGSGRELLQFVGMGESMQPNIADLPINQQLCAITTDGIHGIEEKTLNKILENSSDMKQASDRLTALSRWCGGHDNSTSAIFDMGAISEALALYDGSGIRLWDAHGDLVTLWLREEDQALNYRQARQPDSSDDRKNNPPDKVPPVNTIVPEEKTKRQRPSTKRSKKKSKDTYPKNIELDIEIGSSDEQGESGVDSK